MRKRSKYLKITGFTILALLIILLAGGFIAYSKREAILHSVINKAIKKAKSSYNLNLEIKNPKFEGLRTVAFSEVSIIPENRDSLLYVKGLEVGVQLWPLLTGDLKISDLNIERGKINLIKQDSIRNYDFLFKKKTDSSKTKGRADLAELANKLLNQALYNN